MKIVADENIPYVHEFFDRFGEVKTAPGRKLTNSDVKDADILLVRSVTKVNESLLQGSKVRFVGTCTIGTDHLDKDYLAHNHVVFASAPGCNAGGVVQYDLAALTAVAPQWPQQRVGVIGNGNVGSRLCSTLKALDVDFCAYDPFQSSVDFPYLASLEQVLDCDVVCVHTPYTTAGPYPTHHLISQGELSNIAPGTILLNAGRGGAIDNHALHLHLQKNRNLRVILDVWEDEPKINQELMSLVEIATPHIAGYSFEGKLMGSAIIYSELVKFIGLDREVYQEQCHRLLDKLKGPPIKINADSLASAIGKTYSIYDDDRSMRTALRNAPNADSGDAFDYLRKHYPERREFGHFSVNSNSSELKTLLGNIGFGLDEQY